MAYLCHPYEVGGINPAGAPCPLPAVLDALRSGEPVCLERPWLERRQGRARIVGYRQGLHQEWPVYDKPPATDPFAVGGTCPPTAPTTRLSSGGYSCVEGAPGLGAIGTADERRWREVLYTPRPPDPSPFERTAGWFLSRTEEAGRVHAALWAGQSGSWGPLRIRRYPTASLVVACDPAEFASPTWYSVSGYLWPNQPQFFGWLWARCPDAANMLADAASPVARNRYTLPRI